VGSSTGDWTALEGEVRHHIRALLTALPFVFLGSAAGLADDLPVKAKWAPPDLPLFTVIDDRVTVSYIPHATDPGVYSINPNGSLNSNTAMQVYSFTHFDAWQYGTNFLNLSLYKADHNDPASPCTNAGSITNPATFATTPANCAGATFGLGQLRSTFGWNEIFGTKAFTAGPLHNISFEVGLDASTSNYYRAAAAQVVSGGLQFQFDLPYKGYINVAPMATWVYRAQMGFLQCGGGFAPNTPGVGCLADGDRQYQPTWAIETNYYMNLGFLPESVRYFSISGRATWTGTMGPENSPLPYNPLPLIRPTNSMTAIQLNSEPIRLTFDASKAIWGAKYSHFIDVWVAYRYWQNKYGLDHNVSWLCNLTPGVSNNTCTESSLYSGVTVKF
jgi:hypothetical protein